jgi:hypothetical protein
MMSKLCPGRASSWIWRQYKPPKRSYQNPDCLPYDYQPLLKTKITQNFTENSSNPRTIQIPWIKRCLGRQETRCYWIYMYINWWSLAAFGWFIINDSSRLKNAKDIYDFAGNVCGLWLYMSGMPNVSYHGKRGIVLWQSVADFPGFAVNLPVASTFLWTRGIAYSTSQSCMKGPVHTMEAYRESSSIIARLILNLGTGWRWAVKLKPWALYPPWKTPRYPLNRRVDGL